MWTSFFSAVLLVSAALLGFTAAASQDVLGDMVHEEIIHSDGTIGHFSYHGSFVPDTDVVTDSFHMKLANDYSIAMESYNTAGMLSVMQQLSEVSFVDIQNLTTPNSNPTKRINRPFRGNTQYQNVSYCGWPVPVPDWNVVNIFKRPNTHDCLRFMEMFLHRPGYWDLSGFGTRTNPQEWANLANYDSCEMGVRRMDSDNQWGARVGTMDQITWTFAAILVALGVAWEDPTKVLYLPAMSGSIGCQELGPNPIALLEFELVRNKNAPAPTGPQAQTSWIRPAVTPVDPALSSSILMHPTPTCFPGQACFPTPSTVASNPIATTPGDHTVTTTTTTTFTTRVTATTPAANTCPANYPCHCEEDKCDACSPACCANGSCPPGQGGR